MTQQRTFGNIRKLPSGRYQARYTGPGGIHVKADHTFATKIDAEAWLADRRRQIDRNLWDPEAAAQTRPRATFADYSREWLEQRQVAGRPIRERTRSEYRSLLDRLILPAFGHRELTAIRPADVRAWHATTAVGKPTQRAHAYALFMSIMATAVADEYIDANPARIRGASTVKRARDIRPASVTEIAALTEKMPERLQLMVTLASWCAMRFGETVELRRRDIDLEAGVIRIRRAAVRVNGKYVVGQTKSTAGTRDVAIPPHLLPQFREHLVRHAAPGKDGLLFAADNGGHLHPSVHQRAWYTARAAVDREDLRWHDLRHSGAVLAAATGASLAELMARLGHSTPGAAMRYQHAVNGSDRAVAERLSALAL
ncbi:MAG: hypothetical protein QG597_3931 [Actinomycetota bacterium]|nr:hypothetical protein [Actinomycetota bacterium]